jgi:nicotinamidase-related amidase
MKNIEMLVIDPQYDFCDMPDDLKARDVDTETGEVKIVEPALAVSGAWQDSLRLANFINDASHLINRIDVTLDTHQEYDIAHPLFWKDNNENQPNPFTPISNQDIQDGLWTPVDKTVKEYTLAYTKALESDGKYALFIWPPHCLVGEVGHNVIPPIMKAFKKWERDNIARVNYVNKGHNPFTEHYGGFEAEYPLSDDPTTLLNLGLINIIKEADIVLLTGQALSHCVASTVRQLADNFCDENIGKLVILEDTCSPVAGFEKNAVDFIDEMKERGAIVTKTTNIEITRNELLVK